MNYTLDKVDIYKFLVCRNGLKMYYYKCEIDVNFLVLRYLQQIIFFEYFSDQAQHQKINLNSQQVHIKNCITTAHLNWILYKNVIKIFCKKDLIDFVYHTFIHTLFQPNFNSFLLTTFFTSEEQNYNFQKFLCQTHFNFVIFIFLDITFSI